MAPSQPVKLTLLLDRDLIAEAKRLARANGTSLSRLVAAYFRSLVSSDSAGGALENDGPLVRWILDREPPIAVTEDDVWRDLVKKHGPVE